MNLVLSSQYSLAFRIGIIGLWLALFILLLQRDVFISSVSSDETATLLRAEREEYQGIYFRNQKIGYVVNHYLPGEEQTLQLEQRAHMQLNVADTIHQVDLTLQAELNADDTLKSFVFDFASPFYRMHATGEVQGQQVDFTLTTGNNIIRSSLSVAGPPRLPTARRSYLLKQGLNKGDKVKIPWFDPVSLTAKTSVVEYRGRERQLINGRVHNLHQFLENYGGARVNLWLNDEGDVMKEESPAGFVFVKEPKFKALADTDTSDDLLAAVAVTVTGAMPALEGRQTMQYQLQFPDDGGFSLNSGRQHYQQGLLTIRREQLPPTGREPNGCEGTEGSLQSSTYIQADAPKIIDLATQITDGSEPGLDHVKQLADWVYNNLKKRPVLGIPDALTTLENGLGDCNEHAALFAALARSVGIPTRIAAGVMYHKEAFYYHAWNEVCVDDQWLTLDTTVNQLPADLSHIKFIQGGLNEQVRIGALLGKLVIEPLGE